MLISESRTNPAKEHKKKGMNLRPVRSKKDMQSKKTIISYFQVSGKHKQEVTYTHINKIDVSIIKDTEHWRTTRSIVKSNS